MVDDISSLRELYVDGDLHKTEYIFSTGFVLWFRILYHVYKKGKYGISMRQLLHQLNWKDTSTSRRKATRILYILRNEGVIDRSKNKPFIWSVPPERADGVRFILSCIRWMSRIVQD